jgi:putative transposase
MAFDIIEDGHAYFVTSTVHDWLPVFIATQPVEILIESLVFCRETKHLRIAGNMVMPTHVHVVVYDEDLLAGRLRETMTAWRKFTGSKLAAYVDSDMPSWFGYALRGHATTDRERRFWKHGLHAEAISSREWLIQKLEYMHNNPVRKGFVRRPEDWVHSSANFYATGEIGPVPIDPILI